MPAQTAVSPYGSRSNTVGSRRQNRNPSQHPSPFRRQPAMLLTSAVQSVPHLPAQPPLHLPLPQQAQIHQSRQSSVLLQHPPRASSQGIQTSRRALHKVSLSVGPTSRTE